LTTLAVMNDSDGFWGLVNVREFAVASLAAADIVSDVADSIDAT
jgi:hypothetical protein